MINIETQEALTDSQTQGLETNADIHDLHLNTPETVNSNVSDDDHELEEEEYISDNDYINQHNDLENDDLLPEKFTYDDRLNFAKKTYLDFCNRMDMRTF